MKSAQEGTSLPSGCSAWLVGIPNLACFFLAAAPFMDSGHAKIVLLLMALYGMNFFLLLIEKDKASISTIWGGVNTALVFLLAAVIYSSYAELQIEQPQTEWEPFAFDARKITILWSGFLLCTHLPTAVILFHNALSAKRASGEKTDPTENS